MHISTIIRTTVVNLHVDLIASRKLYYRCTCPCISIVIRLGESDADVHIVDLHPKVCMSCAHDEEQGEAVQPVHRGLKREALSLD